MNKTDSPAASERELITPVGRRVQRVVRAHWEHGRRTHGYWCDVTGQRIGYVGLGHPAFWDKLYRWGLDAWGYSKPSQIRKTLRGAKAAVERAAEEAAFRPNEIWMEFFRNVSRNYSV